MASILLLTLVMLISAMPGVAQPVATGLRQRAAMPGDSLTVSLLTCYPGAEVYALCGHEAIRIRSAAGMDSVWNYGLFSFNQPNFVYRFVKGETDYQLGGYPFAWFMPEYVERGSKVVEQDLNLDQSEAWRLLGMLRDEALPGNNTYRYNYVKDNCATRPLARLDSAASSRIIYPDTNRYGTFRREMRAYHRNYPWYQFGIDLVLGPGLDYELSSREEMFVPVELMDKAAMAHFADGRPLVRDTRVLNEGTPNAVLGPTPWWLTPMFWGWVVFALALTTAIVDIRRGRATRPVYSLYWLLTGAAGVVVWFLLIFSSHEATDANALRWWLSPLMLIAAVTVWVRRLDKVTDVLAWVQGISTVIVLMIWPLQAQSGNPASFPLMGAGAILCAAYAIICARASYNKNTVVWRKPAPRRKPRSGKSSK